MYQFDQNFPISDDFFIQKGTGQASGVAASGMKCHIDRTKKETARTLISRCGIDGEIEKGISRHPVDKKRRDSSMVTVTGIGITTSAAGKHCS